MNTTLFIQFVILNILNVIIQTAKSLITIKCGKTAAAVANAVAYGLYTVVVIYTVCELPLAVKVIVVALCNLIGVYAVKFFEEKSRKDKLWKVEMTVLEEDTILLDETLCNLSIPHNYIPSIGKYSVFSLYCATQKDSLMAKEVANKFNAKYFVTESKTL